MPNHVSMKTRIAVYRALLDQTFVVCEKDNKYNHPTFGDSNLHVWMLLRSLEARGMVRETFNWKHHYYFVTEAGEVFLRKFFSLPEDYISAIAKDCAKNEAAKTEAKVEAKAEKPAEETAEVRA